MSTIIYLTENSLDEHIAKVCQKKLLEEAGDMSIISVSQKPINFGRNVCVGEIGRSWLSLYKQLYAGLKEAETENIVIAEHDCLYTKEHLNWTPPTNDKFYYNMNCWLLQWGGNHPELTGMYSYWKNRYVLSQLICNTSLFRNYVEGLLNLLGENINKELRHCEPGICTEAELDKVREIAKSGKSAYLTPYLKNYLEKYKSDTFYTEIPNLDIRHGTNFTGPRRGNKRRYELPYWGKFEEVI